ncbi:MAG: DUF2162 domain-containing protein [Caldimicrobium sp.]
MKDLNFLLWLGGMLFSLGVFAIKVGFGLGLGSVSKKGITLSLLMYLIIFILIALVSGKLIGILKPLLQKGPYIHLAIALGMILWGVYLLNFEKIGSEEKASSRVSALPLLIPCPVCLSAITVSTWAALQIINWHPAIVGFGLGILFCALSLGVYLLVRFFSKEASILKNRVKLGLSMILIGSYFVASLYLPGKIEEAKEVYKSFLAKDYFLGEKEHLIGVLGLIFLTFILGYLSALKRFHR